MRSALLLWLTVGPAAAQTGEPVERTRTIGTIVVNQRRIGDGIVLIVDGEPHMMATVFEHAGLVAPPAARRTLDGDRLVNLAAVPSLRASWRADDEILEIEADADAFAATAVTLGPVGRTPAQAMTSVVANYAVSARAGGTAVSSDVAAHWKGLLWQSALSVQRTRGGHLVLARGLSSVTFDDQRRLVRWEVGESIQRSLLHGARRVVGVSVSRAFDIDPSATWQSPVALGGAVAAPSSAEVFVNGQLVARTELAAGQFELRDIPAGLGAGDVRVVLRDAYGRQQDLTQSIYRSPSVLRPGLHQFRYLAGVAPAFGTMAGRTVVQADHRLGLAPGLTAGFTLAGEGTRWTGGPVVATQSRLGAAEIGLVGQVDRGASRVGGSLAYEYRGRVLSFRGAVRPSVDAWLPAPMRYDASANVGASPVRTLTLMAGWGQAHDRLTGRTTRGTLGATWSVSGRSNLQLLVSHTQGSSRVPSRSLGLTWTTLFGDRSTAALAWNGTGHGAGDISTTVHRAMPIGPGIGYSGQWSDGMTGVTRAMLSAQQRTLRADLQHTRINGVDTWEASAAGAAVFTAHGTHLSRPIHDAWAIVEVPGRTRVLGFANRQPVGTTSGGGRLLIPTLASYADARLSVDEDELPMGVTLSAHEVAIRPGLRGGVRVRFGETTVRAFIARLRTAALGGLVGAKAALHGRRDEWLAASPIGNDGEVYFEVVVGAPARILVTSSRGQLQCVVPAAASDPDEPLRDLGVLVCRETSLAQSLAQ